MESCEIWLSLFVVNFRQSPRNGTTPTDGVLARTDIFMTLWSGESPFLTPSTPNERTVLKKGLTLPGGVAGLTGISTTLQSALDPPRSLTPPDGAPDPMGTSRTLSPPRDLTRRDGVGAQMAISMTLLKSRCGFAYSPRCVTNNCFASFSLC